MTVGKRKLLVAVVISFMIFMPACFFLYQEKITGEQWIDLAQWVGAFGLSTFTGGNVLVHLIEMLRDKDALKKKDE